VDGLLRHPRNGQESRKIRPSAVLHRQGVERPARQLVDALKPGTSTGSCGCRACRRPARRRRSSPRTMKVELRWAAPTTLSAMERLPAASTVRPSTVMPADVAGPPSPDATAEPFPATVVTTPAGEMRCTSQGAALTKTSPAPSTARSSGTEIVARVVMTPDGLTFRTRLWCCSEMYRLPVRSKARPNGRLRGADVAGPASPPKRRAAGLGDAGVGGDRARPVDPPHRAVPAVGDADVAGGIGGDRGRQGEREPPDHRLWIVSRARVLEAPVAKWETGRRRGCSGRRPGA
jgi:hypothetical protein